MKDSYLRWAFGYENVPTAIIARVMAEKAHAEAIKREELHHLEKSSWIEFWLHNWISSLAFTPQSPEWPALVRLFPNIDVVPYGIRLAAQGQGMWRISARVHDHPFAPSPYHSREITTDDLAAAFRDGGTQ